MEYDITTYSGAKNFQIDIHSMPETVQGKIDRIVLLKTYYKKILDHLSYRAMYEPELETKEYKEFQKYIILLKKLSNLIPRKIKQIEVLSPMDLTNKFS